jgi:hypothetical protein
MRQQKRQARDPTPEELTDNMADAVTYLSRVAHDAGFEAISTDLLLISCRLRDLGSESLVCDEETTANYFADPCNRKH